MIQPPSFQIPEAFGGLSADQRLQLREWQHRAGEAGIDAVEDLSTRAWPCPISGSVIGIFQSGAEAARWLVIGQDDAWAVAYCTQGEVSRTLRSLSEALALIYPGTSVPVATKETKRLLRQSHRGSR